MSVAVLVLLSIASFVTAAISGTLGLAGGIALLGVMTVVLPARAVIPIHGVVQLCSNVTRTIVFARDVRWRIFAIYSGPYLAGIALATMMWSGALLDRFRALIGVFLVVFLVWRRRVPKLRNPPMWIYAPLGLVTGLLAIFVGATGPFIAPFFLRDDFAKEETIATSAMCQAWGHVAKIPAFLALGFDFTPYWKVLLLFVASAVLGTFTGRSLLERLSKRVFTLIFELALGAIAAHLILSGIAPWMSEP